MDADFWHERWADGRTAFHEGAPNGLLVDHFARLGDLRGRRVFMPLCGKAFDVGWFRQQGSAVVGAELSRLAVMQLFESLEIDPVVTRAGAFELFEGPGIQIFVGDVFDLTMDDLGRVDIVYDRAALVALPVPTRRAYSKHVPEISRHARQLMITLEYDQAAMTGPPFSVTAEEVASLYSDRFELTSLEARRMPNGLRAVADVREHAWLFEQK